MSDTLPGPTNPCPGVLFYLIGCVGFLIVVITSPARMELLALIYFGGISSSFLYTGGIGLKYIALGDILIMVTFGPVSVLYSFVAQTGQSLAPAQPNLCPQAPFGWSVSCTPSHWP